MTTSVELKYCFLMNYLSAQIFFLLLSRMVTRVINFSNPTSFSLPKTELKRLFETRRITILINFFFIPQVFVQLLSMAPYIVIMNSNIQVQPVSPLQGMMKSSEKSTFNTRQDQRMINSAKSEKEKTTNSTSATQGESVQEKVSKECLGQPVYKEV